MHPVKTRAKRKRTVLVLVLALGVGLPPPAQAYLLDFTVSSINPVVLISHAGGYPSRPPPVGSDLKVVDVSHLGDLGRQFSPTITPPHKILNSPTGSLVDYCSNVPSATSVWMHGGTSPQGSITLQGGIPPLNMSGGTSLSSGGFGTASVTEPAPVRGNAFFYLAGSNFTDNKNDGLLAYFGIPHQTANGNFDPGFAASFASAPGAFTGTMVTSGNILNHLAPFSSTLLLLGSGLMGLVGLRYRRRRG
ncbi:MAG: hypothetical protein L6277_00560 [Desulfobacterales bacterium]|nr:hypothetical protein [Pseudomonadota bacterium]MBU4356609.1 hypothetical protein [Pseudomonadota bacterium]MCG2770566.1 hypothetical protein [Desulfobacterales bacterium]